MRYLVFFTLITVVGLSSGCQASPSTGLVENGGFSHISTIKTVDTYLELPQELADEFRENGYWHLVLGDVAMATLDFSDDTANVQIENGGALWYSVQFCYLPLPLEESKTYTVTFDAKADTPRGMVFEIAHVGDDWKSYTGRKSITLATEWQTYEYVFTMRRSDPNTRLEFNLGGDAVGAYFDNVKVIENITQE